jgi:hypothetical protein
VRFALPCDASCSIAISGSSALSASLSAGEDRSIVEIVKMRPKIPRPKGPGARTLVRAVDGDLRVEPGLVRPDLVVERLRGAGAVFASIINAPVLDRGVAS